MVTRKITSAQHPLVKRWVKLRQDKSFRQEEKAVLVSGKKLVRELKVKTLIADTDLPEADVVVTPEILKKITGLAAPEGVAAEVALPESANLRGKKFIVVLDGVSDPGNVGTLLRTALALGWEGAFLTDGCADPFNDKAIRAARGASFRLPLGFGSFEALKKLAEGMNVYIADLKGKPPETARPPILLILGSESHGPSSAAQKLGTPITIPMPGPMESLNVATAGGILMFNLRGKL
jgi:TrmH family RNA methyltransferase